jgi:hypothetical protein
MRFAWMFVMTGSLMLAGVMVSKLDVLAMQQAPQTLTPVATSLQVMNELTKPTSDGIFGAFLVTVSEEGIERRAPESDEDWQALEDKAAMLVESGNLLLVGDRVQDEDTWIEMAQAFIDASLVSLAATRARDAEALEASFDPLYVTCEQCHLKYFKE